MPLPPPSLLLFLPSSSLTDPLLAPYCLFLPSSVKVHPAAFSALLNQPTEPSETEQASKQPLPVNVGMETARAHCLHPSLTPSLPRNLSLSLLSHLLFVRSRRRWCWSIRPPRTTEMTKSSSKAKTTTELPLAAPSRRLGGIYSRSVVMVSAAE